METNDYQKALDAAHSEIQEILQQKFVLDARLSQLQKTVDALSSLVDEVQPIAELYQAAAEGAPVAGISNAIRRILVDSKIPMTPVRIKTALSGRGFDMTEYSNPSAVIHNTLKRLEKQKELVVVRDPAGVIAYAIHRSLTRPDADPSSSAERSSGIKGKV